ncbi:Huntingtin [Aphelenchoides fujianensis]|nr:Huntingtin [Aphelenchoides fujianensis]
MRPLVPTSPGRRRSSKSFFGCARCLAELADESTTLSSADYRAILCGFHSIPRHLNGFESIKFKAFDRILNCAFVEELRFFRSRATSWDTPIGSDFYSALHELFHRAEMKEYTTNDYFAVEHLCLAFPKALRFKLNRNHWNVDLKSECTISERLKEEILESFNLIQRAAHFLFATTQFSDQFHQEARQALIAIIRMPVFSKMFVVPRVALTRDWALNMVGQTNKIHVPLINIHMLNDPEILNDFVRRVLLIGWTQKSQFEDWWMSLFGVLCSTPTGEELESEDVQKTCEQIQASSTAVEALTNMIVQSLLFPTPGDTTVNSENGKHAAIGRNFIEFGFQPELAFVRNAERGEFNERFYSLGQTSAYFLWSISGELENTSLVPSTPETSTMNTDLDVSSSLKSLLENFFHWCRQGFHKLPLPLLTSTVRSFAMLSDFFNDPTLYSTVYVEMKLLFNRREFDEHPLNGYLIYLLLKCVAIGNSVERRENTKKMAVWLQDSIDPDCTSAEVSQAVEGYVRSGLESTSVFVSSATLQGILYLLQSVNGDSYNAVLLSTFRLLGDGDQPAEQDLEAVEYHELVFVVAFRLFEQVAPAEAESSQKFVAILRVLFMDPRLPTWQRRVLSNGIQTLVIHNVSYCEVFREAAVELFDTYQLRPLHFPYALSVYSTCIYRLAQHESRLTADKMTTFESDFQKLLNILSFYAVRKYADNFLPPIARLALVVLDKEKVLVLSSYDRNIFYLLYYALRFMISEQQRATLELAKRVVLPRLSSLPSNHFSTYLTTLVLCSLSTEAEVHLLVHLLLEKEPERELLAFVYGRSMKRWLLETCKSLRVPLDVGEIPASAL